MATRKIEVEETPNENNINLLNLESGGKYNERKVIQHKNLKRLNNTSKVNFLNTTPKAAAPKWDIIGRGITSKRK